MYAHRLLTAAEWAEKNINPEMFHMALFRQGQYELPECDSVGCMVGHLTAIDSENVMKNYTDTDIDFKLWSKDYFGLNKMKWHYLFGSDWSKVDNTLQGAIARMRRLANGMSYKEIKLELKKI